MAASTDRAEVVIIDTSGSMCAGRKMPAVRAAATTAVDCLDDGVAFAVIAGAERGAAGLADGHDVRRLVAFGRARAPAPRSNA